MTTARQSQAVMRIVRRHPRAGGLVLLLLGALMTGQSLREGSQVARFVGASAVEGRVDRVEPVGGGLPEFRLHATWTGVDGIERSGETRVYKYESKHLSPGDPVSLLVARDNPGEVMTRRIYDRKGIVALGPTPATPLVFAGLLMVLGGVFLLATGNRFLRSAE